MHFREGDFVSVSSHPYLVLAIPPDADRLNIMSLKGGNSSVLFASLCKLMPRWQAVEQMKKSIARGIQAPAALPLFKEMVKNLDFFDDSAKRWRLLKKQHRRLPAGWGKMTDAELEHYLHVRGDGSPWQEVGLFKAQSSKVFGHITRYILQRLEYIGDGATNAEFVPRFDATILFAKPWFPDAVMDTFSYMERELSLVLLNDPLADALRVKLIGKQF